ncbi:uncharacterized protein Z520_00627 [Fonsecaea multimorphosa CBS 102226]|uniref:Ion transport domain-containing protein n=1 Tax=Fonsecaea multimorphosa CBS 102226 TaxID=1442371 RepID=A0A0D2KKG3_9EURO|nr:uncharacterized protein Z520_00627 [Fonsecaea multimorphosa CBS 102226]KIY03935.1 hypothetical protein Z520_00627 [Fonsecaea multimorphosa CBS 102226]OAL31776.1 hypothetical protein AYO22_00646 [Fonsecaea multimorphosa]
MISFSLTRAPRNQRRRERSPFSSTYTRTTRSPENSRNPTWRRSSEIDHDPFSQNEDDEDMDDQGDGSEDEEDEDGAEQEEETIEDAEDVGDEDEDGPDDTTPLLPIFSAARLDTIPVFAITHAVRLLVSSRCDTVLSWEQLRAPQISQFLVKPIEQEIRSNHMNAATHYALMANCLQYSKEAAMSPGSSGTNKTRAMVCELIAIKLLKDFSTRELIDALSYDFDPLQGQLDAVPHAENERRNTATSKKPAQRPARISCFEIAIRAQAKKFLSHPMVVKQLEAIWAGTIVFHSAADNLHRPLPAMNRRQGYGTNDGGFSAKPMSFSTESGTPRRAVTLYNPRDASLFKLSRLRVPRYRNILSTLSFAVLLSLFVAVLVQRSLEITTLEVIFWFWAAGYMLDEIVGFNEQGFSLYIASFWNTFDLGILLILVIHLALRLYGILMPDVRKHMVANMAYDVLAADAILLFPRLFSVLDHYRYFSPLLIAFRYMAADLIAVSLLILISCSGFFVALTLSFGNDGIDTPSSVAYALLQMLMGFTPAAWDRWDGYNILGKTILTLFLFICHFLVVTILITVLTNSFMAIVQNASEEHQFLFAVNTISHVKSDALFSYVAPTNILQWLLVPVRYFVPFRQYVKINRTIIKITHLPLLFSILLYEKTIMQSTAYDSIDLVEHRGRVRRTTKFTRLNRAPSIATFRQDRALEEVFRQPFDSTIRNTQPSRDRRKASNVVSTWMNKMGDVADPPQEQDRQVVDKLEAKEIMTRRPRQSSRLCDFSRPTMSVVSDPEDFTTNAGFLSPGETQPLTATPSALEQPSHNTDADGDDEMPTNDDGDEEDTTTFEHRSPNDTEPEQHNTAPAVPEHRDYFTAKPIPGRSTPETGQLKGSISQAKLEKAGSGTDSPSPRPPKDQTRHHSRNVSAATMIFKPMTDSSTDQTSSVEGSKPPHLKTRISAPGSGVRTPVSKPGSSGAGHRTPKRAAGPTRLRPILASKDEQGFRSTPNLAGLLSPKNQPAQVRRKPSLEMDLVSDIGDNRAIGGGYVGALPSSFAAHMVKGTIESRHEKEQKEQQEMFTKILMARMNALEESFREVIHEMRDHMRQDDVRGGSRGGGAKTNGIKARTREKEVGRPLTASNDAEAATPRASSITRLGEPAGAEQTTTEVERGGNEEQEAREQAHSA